MNSEIKAGEIARVLRYLASEYPDAVYPFEEYADFVVEQQIRIIDLESALNAAAKEYNKELCKLVPENNEVALPDELVASWKEEAGITEE